MTNKCEGCEYQRIYRTRVPYGETGAVMYDEECEYTGPGDCVKPEVEDDSDSDD